MDFLLSSSFVFLGGSPLSSACFLLFIVSRRNGGGKTEKSYASCLKSMPNLD